MPAIDLSDGTVVEGSPLSDSTVIYEHCDADQACDRAKYEVFICGSDLFKGCRKLYFCGHHFHQYESIFFTDRKYEVRKI